MRASVFLRIRLAILALSGGWLLGGGTNGFKDLLIVIRNLSVSDMAAWVLFLAALIVLVYYALLLADYRATSQKRAVQESLTHRGGGGIGSYI